jgi:hypothetical protein
MKAVRKFFGRIFCGQGICAANSLTAKNRAFRAQSSESAHARFPAGSPLQSHGAQRLPQVRKSRPAKLRRNFAAIELCAICFRKLRDMPAGNRKPYFL